MNHLKLFLFLLLFDTPFLSHAQEVETVVDTTHLILDKIEISGNTFSRKVVLLRELNVEQGDTLQKNKLDEIAQTNSKRLMSMSIFTYVNISWDINEQSLSMLIQVKERFPVYPEGSLEFADRNPNVWWVEHHHDIKRINLGLTLLVNNFRGNKEELSFTGQIGFTQKIGLSYSIPNLDKSRKHGIGASFNSLWNKEIAYQTTNNKLDFYRDDQNFMLKRKDFSLWYTYRPAYAWTHKLSLTYQHFNIDDKIAQFNPNYLGDGATKADLLWSQYQVRMNLVDNWNYPLTGMRLIASADFKFFAQHTKPTQIGLSLQYDYYMPLPYHFFADLIFRGRIANGGQLPYILQENMGYGYNYIRGFEYYVIDGNAFALTRLELKNRILHLRIPTGLRFFEIFPLDIYAKTYTDSGFATSTQIHNSLNRRFLYSGGFGLDIVTLYDIKLRIEYTLNNFGQKGLFLQQNGL